MMRRHDLKSHKEWLKLRKNSKYPIIWSSGLDLSITQLQSAHWGKEGGFGGDDKANVSYKGNPGKTGCSTYSIKYAAQHRERNILPNIDITKEADLGITSQLRKLIDDILHVKQSRSV